MNDSIIINAISKIQFILVSIFSFIFLILFILFIVLQNGVYIDTLSFQNVKIEKLYIKWDEKVSFIVDGIIITKESDNDNSEVDYENIISLSRNTLPFLLWFKEISIKEFLLDDLKYRFDYMDEKKSVNLTSTNFTLKSTLFFDDNLLLLKINELKAMDKNVLIDGDLIFNTKDSFELIARLNIDINNSTKLHLLANGDRKSLSYSIESIEDIKNTREIVDLFEVHPDVKYWIYDAIEMSSLSLDGFYGWLEYKNLDKAYLNFYAKATANNLTYTYDKKLDSVRTSKTDLEFKDGVLYIKPQNAYSYNFYLDKSWLKIDFSKQEELLTLYLLFKGQLNRDLLSLLEHYEIKLPFTQNSGFVDTNLTLDVNLISLGVEAFGNFYTKEAEINYLGLDIDIYNAHILLDNYDVKVENMLAKYRDIATANVDLYFDANSSNGTLMFRFDKISLVDSNISLLKNGDTLEVSYIISKDQDYLAIDKSSWLIKDQTLYVDEMKIPFDIKELTAVVPPTNIYTPDLFAAKLSGDLFLNSKKADLYMDLTKLSYLDLSLDQKLSSLKLLYDEDKLSISSSKPIKLSVAKNKMTLDNFMVDITPNRVEAKDLSINFEDILTSKIDAKIDLSDSTMLVDLKDLDFKNESFGEIFKKSEDIKLSVKNIDNKTSIRSDELDINFINDSNGWKIELNSIDKISPNSNILKEYNLTNGKSLIYKKREDNRIKFSLNTDYKYKILVLDNTPIENYQIYGEFEFDKGTNLKINNLVDVKIDDDIKITTADIGINIDDVLNFFADKNSTKEENETKSKDLYFEAKNSFLYLSQNREIISDTINLQYINEDLNAKLLHKAGKATLRLYNDVLNLYGDKFDDEFMSKLFSLSKFDGGTLEFYINGSTKEYSGTLYIRDTTIQDYKILNNILAFVNTIPSLVTLSLPGYNQTGIAAKSAYMNFKYKDDIYKINTLNLKSKEIEIVGLGEASIKNNSINMDLNLKTGLGSSISKIPFVGQILLGKETLSTTLKLSGTLDDPEINTQVAKDIASAPINIIKRTFMYPFELLEDNENK